MSEAPDDHDELTWPRDCNLDYSKGLQERAR